MNKAKWTAILAVVSGVMLLLMVAVAVLFSSLLRKSITIEAGDVSLSASDFLRKGPSLLNYRLLTDLDGIDTKKPGDYVVQFLVNGKTQHSLLKIEDTTPPTAVVKKELAVPVGTEVSVDRFIESIDDNTKVNARIQGSGDYVDAEIINDPGDHEIELIFEDLGKNKISKTATLHVCDIKDRVTLEAGKKLKASKFLNNKEDKAEILTDVKGITGTPGEYKILVSWNGTEVESGLIVTDTTPPEISEAEELKALAGSTILYKKYVNVTDNSDGECSLEVDTKGVNPYEEGNYDITYTAKDPSGNVSKKTFSIEIYKLPEVSDKELSKEAEAVLDELEIEEGSKVTREKLHDLYRWLKTTVKYTGTSDKSSLPYAAYEGFKTHNGDCYTYASMAHVLFTKLGLDDMIITRDSDKFHSWNLVEFEGTWYHFDACPLSKGETFECFLVGDAELAAFSESYGKREPEHAGYYVFDGTLYPERAK